MTKNLETFLMSRFIFLEIVDFYKNTIIELAFKRQ